MTARLYPFPAARRVKLIRSTAAQMRDCTRDRGEKTLATAMQRQADSMGRKGFAPEVIKSEIRALELAIRAQLWCLVMRNGGAA